MRAFAFATFAAFAAALAGCGDDAATCTGADCAGSGGGTDDGGGGVGSVPVVASTGTTPATVGTNRQYLAGDVIPLIKEVLQRPGDLLVRGCVGRLHGHPTARRSDACQRLPRWPARRAPGRRRVAHQESPRQTNDLLLDWLAQHA